MKKISKFAFVSLLGFSIVSVADIALIDTLTNSKQVACLRSAKVTVQRCEEASLSELACEHPKCQTTVSELSEKTYFTFFAPFAPTGPYSKTEAGLSNLKDAVAIEINIEKKEKLQHWLENLENIIKIRVALLSSQLELKVTPDEVRYALVLEPFTSVARERRLQESLGVSTFQLDIQCPPCTDYDFIQCKSTLLSRNSVWDAEPMAVGIVEEGSPNCVRVREVIMNTPATNLRFSASEPVIFPENLSLEKSVTWQKFPGDSKACPYRESGGDVEFSCGLGLKLKESNGDGKIMSNTKGIVWGNSVSLSDYGSLANLYYGDHSGTFLGTSKASFKQIAFSLQILSDHRLMDIIELLIPRNLTERN